MRAITVKQPWAWAIAIGAKTVENRSRSCPWTTAIGQRIAIHAGKGWDADAFDHPRMFGLAERVAYRRHGHKESYPAAALIEVMVPQVHHAGAVLATAVLEDVHLDGAVACACGTDEWAGPDAWHLLLQDVQPLRRPVPARGYQGLWPLPADVDAAVLEQTPVPA